MNWFKSMIQRILNPTDDEDEAIDESQLFHLYDELEKHRQHRDRLAMYMMLYGGAAIALSSLPDRGYRALGISWFFAGLLVVIIVLGALGMLLLAAFIYNFRAVRQTKREIEDLRAKLARQERKKKRRGISNHVA